MTNKFDVAIIGGGPAGMTAALFAKRMGMSVVLFNSVENLSNLEASYTIENWPGIETINGIELSKNMKKHIESVGVEIKNETAIELLKLSDHFSVRTTKKIYDAKTLIISTGLKNRKIGVSGEDKFAGKGVGYCVSCDGPLFAGKDVAVIGGGNSAIGGAVMLDNIANKIYLIHRRDEFRADEAELESLKKSKNIEKVMNSLLHEIQGDTSVKSIIIKDVKTGETSKIKVDGVFIEIGSVPITEVVKKIGVDCDDAGFIKVNKSMETKVPGVFAAGDITNGPLKQIVTATADGAVAATSAHRFIKK